MPTIKQIYSDYQIMQNLQDHQLRVASVAKIIAENSITPLNTDNIVKACLLHDMGNIIKFELGRFPESVEDRGLKYWQEVQENYVKKYGDSEHLATEKIAEELGVSKEISFLVDQIGFSKSKQNLDSDSFEQKICSYSDMRVGPHSVLTLQGRLDDLKARYANRPKRRSSSESSETLMESLKLIEKQIFENSKIKPEDINDESIKETMKELEKINI